MPCLFGWLLPSLIGLCATWMIGDVSWTWHLACKLIVAVLGSADLWPRQRPGYRLKWPIWAASAVCSWGMGKLGSNLSIALNNRR